MSMYEVGPGNPVMPSVGFIYGKNGKVVGETMPITGPLVETFIDGCITAEEYFKFCEEESAAN